MSGAARFIVIEGGEGAGKSTQAALLSSWMAASKIDHRRTREPGGTPVSEAIRSIVLARSDLDVPPTSELFLILAARAAFVRDVVRPALNIGLVVVSDRYALSSLAYQGYGRGLDLDEIRRANTLATGGLEPDLYLVLDVPVDEGARRQRRDGMPPDRIERSGTVFLQRVRDGYLALARSESNVRVIDGSGAPEEVHRRIRSLLMAEFPATFAAAKG